MFYFKFVFFYLLYKIKFIKNVHLFIFKKKNNSGLLVNALK